jgi:hypothetical protein
VPQASGAARTVSARIVSGELELLPRWAPPPGQRRGLAARKPMLAAQIAVAVLSLG